MSDTLLSQLQNCATLPPLASFDHFGMSLTIKWKPISPPSQPRSVWVYKDADFIKAIMSWFNQLTGTHWYQSVGLKIMEKCIPRQRLKKQKHLRWLSSNIVKQIKKKEMPCSRKLVKLTNSIQWIQENEEQSCWHDQKRQEKLLNPMTPSNKQFWKIVKMYNKVKHQFLSYIHWQCSCWHCIVRKLKCLNKFFAKCWNDSEPSLYKQNCEDSFNEIDIEDLLCRNYPPN